MSDTPWLGDASSLVDEFRAGNRSPKEELQATLSAIESSNLNCWAHLDPEHAFEAAENADITKPFGGVPTGIKELEPVKGWPFTEASLLFKDRVATRTSTMVERLIDDGGAIPVGSTTSSEFGGLNVSVSKINGVAHNPWQYGKTVGGSSGGSSAAVAGGHVSLACGGDGGGSIRIPAGYTGLLGMKGTYGRIPRGPDAYNRPSTVVLGCQARSVRDAARYYDVCAGYDTMDPSSLPKRAESWEGSLGKSDFKGRKVVVDPSLGGIKLDPGVHEYVEGHAKNIIDLLKLERIDREINTPVLSAQWAMGNLSTLMSEIKDKWPAQADGLTDELSWGIRLSQGFYNLHVAADAEKLRVQTYEAMANVFEDADFVICATNPGPAFPAEQTMSTASTGFVEKAKSSKVGKVAFGAAMFGARLGASFRPQMPSNVLEWGSRQIPDVVNMGGLTILSNIVGNPAVSIPAGTIDGLPVGIQVLAKHHEDALLLDLALAYEREFPWPMVAPGIG